MYVINNQQFLKNATSSNRNLQMKFYVDDVLVDVSNIVEKITLTYEIPEEEYHFGSFPIPLLEFTLNNNVPCKLGSEVRVVMEFESREDVTKKKIWIQFPYHTFKVHEQELKEYVTVFKAYHKFYYNLSEQYVPYQHAIQDPSELYTPRSMLDDISAMTGVQYENIDILPQEPLPKVEQVKEDGTTITNNYEGKTCFEMICQIASLYGYSCIFTRDDKIRFTDLVDTGILVTNLSTPTRSQVSYNNTCLRVWLDDKNAIIAGTNVVETNAENITEITNSFMTQAKANTLMERISQIKYEQYEFKFALADLRLEPFDMIQILHRGELKKIPLQYMKLIMTNKSVTAEVKSFAKDSKTATGNSGYQGSITKGLANAYTLIDQTQEQIRLEAVNTKNELQAQITVNAEQIALKVNKADFGSMIEQNAESITLAVNNSQGSNGMRIESSGVSILNNDKRTILLNEGVMNVYNSSDETYMGYFGTVDDDLRVQLYGSNTFSIFAGDDNIKILSVDVNRAQRYGNAMFTIVGGIILEQRENQDVGYNGILLGNDDTATEYGFHNMSIRCHNSLGFADNHGLTHMFFRVRKGDIVMKGTLYQQTNTPPSTYALRLADVEDEDEAYSSGYTQNDIVDSILELETTVHVNSDEEYSMRILPNRNDLTMSIIGENVCIDNQSITTGLVETVKYLNDKINALTMELEELKQNQNQNK